MPGKVRMCLALLVRRSLVSAVSRRMTTPTSTPRDLVASGKDRAAEGERQLAGQKGGWVSWTGGERVLSFDPGSELSEAGARMRRLSLSCTVTSPECCWPRLMEASRQSVNAARTGGPLAGCRWTSTRRLADILATLTSCLK